MMNPLPIPAPYNEPILSYAPGTPERKSLRIALDDTSTETKDLPMIIGGEQVRTEETFEVRAPHRHSLHLGTGYVATRKSVEDAVGAALDARHAWAELPYEERAAIFLRAADLLAGPWRSRMNAATILGQSKSVFQAEIDSACELIDMWRWNVSFANELLREQPYSPIGSWNRTELRPLEGFILAITPFNFTSIAGNLPTAPAIMGNTVVWKPSPTQQLSASLILDLLTAAGLPPGVINMVSGDGAAVSEVALPHEYLAGIHFTGSTNTFRHLWKSVAHHLDSYRTYPRLVGETGGKDFILAHPSADPKALTTALLRGAFEFQGQKCSSASRAYIPKPLWNRIKSDLIEETISLPLGDPANFTTHLGAVIDNRAFTRITTALYEGVGDPHLTLHTGGTWDETSGWYIFPTIFETDTPKHPLMETELFGPVLTVYTYEETEWDDILTLVDTTSPYGLTGAVFATDRAAIAQASNHLRHAAGNFYINDKPTGAVIGQQPFGGARASGTNDKAGSPWNLIRWASPRSIKETFVPPTDWRYPHLNFE
ncbi:MAG: L-glutamate gamma-semialdehyde dehydrogenase [Candidatus Dormibacteria bacterium]